MHSRAPFIRPPTVLIASKHEWNSRSLESILVPHGYLVLRAYTGRVALERARNDRPDAIIIDAQLPDGDGWDVCRALRARQLISDSTPVLIALSEWPTRQHRLDAKRAGIWDCVSQPLDADEFVATLDVFIRAKLNADVAPGESLVDAATGLYNRRGVTRRARELGSLAARQRAPLSCVLLGAEFGPAGSRVGAEDAAPASFSRMAQTFQSAARLSDVIGRLGPLEFAVVAPSTDAERARRLAERLATTILAQPDPTDSRPLRLRGGCYGVSDFHAASIDAVDLLQRASAALHRARTDRTGPWLRSFDDKSGVPA